MKGRIASLLSVSMCRAIFAAGLVAEASKAYYERFQV
jgi:hypothetical protein